MSEGLSVEVVEGKAEYEEEEGDQDGLSKRHTKTETECKELRVKAPKDLLSVVLEVEGMVDKGGGTRVRPVVERVG